MSAETIERAKFKAMTEGTAEDWRLIMDQTGPLFQNLPDRVLSHLKMLKDEPGGHPVDRLEHSLQAASLAFRDGMDEEYVVCALLHDMGDLLAPYMHAELAAVILKPFVSAENHWMVEKHSTFQGYYFFHYIGMDRNAREQYRGHPCFERTALFCARHDQNAFDPNYDTMPFEAFVPMVQRVLTQRKTG